jgi:ABC-type multidrug transport system fused ATPase/permease subunit
MAVVLSLYENMDLLLFLVKLAVTLGAIAIALLILFWLRLRQIETHIYKSKSLKSRLNQKISARVLPRALSRGQRSLPINQSLSKINHPKAHQTQVYSQNSSTNVLKKRSDRFFKTRPRHFRWHWLLAIAIASITGIAIALLQLGSNLISPDLMPLIWLLIGVTLVVSATFGELN